MKSNSQPIKATEQIRAHVCNVFPDYVVVTPEEEHDFDDGQITFSMEDWSGSFPPKKGQLVILTSVEQFTRGWRARKAEPIVLSKKSKKQGGA